MKLIHARTYVHTHTHTAWRWEGVHALGRVKVLTSLMNPESSSTLPLIPLLGTMVARKPTDQIDSAPFVVGMITVLKQFNSEYQEQFFACCGQYVRSLVEATATK